MFSKQELGQTEGMGRNMGRRTKGLTMHRVVLVRSRGFRTLRKH